VPAQLRVANRQHLSTVHRSAAIITEDSVAGKYIKHLVKYALAICKECRHGVLPSQIKSHLQQHCVSRKQAKLAAEDVSS
jgi:hypothetical protein